MKRDTLRSFWAKFQNASAIEFAFRDCRFSLMGVEVVVMVLGGGIMLFLF